MDHRSGGAEILREAAVPLHDGLHLGPGGRGRALVVGADEQQVAHGYLLDRGTETKEALGGFYLIEVLAAAAQDPAEPRVPPAGTVDPAERRARKLWLFFAQPFFVAEPYRRRSGAFVSRAEALRGRREILDGLHDDLPDEASYFTGGIDEIRARAVKPGA